MEQKLNRETVFQSALEYFKGDDLTANVWVDKYCLKDSSGNYYERTPDDMHRRMAKEFARIEANYPNPMREQEIYELFKDFKYVVPQGGSMAGIGNDFVTTSLSNCFVIGNEGQSDSYGGIMKIDQEQVQLMKRRGGVGHDLSHLRPRGMVANGAKLKGETGMTLYMERYSNSTREVAQDSRRGALMLSTSIKHPDAEAFIDKKMDTSKVTGANVSVKVDDEFMAAVNLKREYIQRFPVDSFTPLMTKAIDPVKLWNKIVHNAWKSAEPGILFWDTILRECPTAGYGESWRPVSTNPCQPSWATVLTPNGIKPLGEVNIGQKIWSKEGWTKIINKWSNGVKDVYEYRTTRNVFYGTENHKVVDNGVKVEVKGAKEIDSLQLYSSPYNIQSLNNQDIMDGLVIGDGSIHKASNNLVFLYIGENDTDYFNSEINSLIIKHRHGLNKYAYEINTTISGEELPLLPIRQIPDRFFYGDKLKVCGFLRGLYSANGSIVDKRITLKTSSPKLRDQVQIMLSSVGINSYFTTNKKKNVEFKNGEYECKESYDINISTDRVVFYNLIGFIQVYKTDKLKEIIKTKNSGRKEKNPIKSINKISNEEVFDITVDNNSHTYWTGGCNVSNCGEIPICPHDSCRLIAINLYSYIVNPFTVYAYFDWNLFKSHVAKAQRLMDDLIDLEIEKIDKIIDKIKADPESDEIKAVELNLWNKVKQKAVEGRRTGLGVTAEGDMLAALGLKYGTVEATTFATAVHRKLAVNAYKSSIDMAVERGAFPAWDGEKDQQSVFLNRICDVLDEEYQEKWGKAGRRNIALLTIAPTGTTSLMTQTSSGIEPAFLPFYKRRRKVEDPKLCVFKDEVGDMWEEFFVIHPKLKVWYEVNNIGNVGVDNIAIEQLNEEELQEIFKTSPYFGSTSNDIDYVEKVRMQGEIQKWIDHSISVTVNMPNSATEEMVSDVYKKAWQFGCKGVTVYRDGCRSGVLVSSTPKNEDGIEYKSAPKRPKTLDVDIYVKTALKKDWTIIVGLMGNKPYEIFAFEQLSNTEFPKDIEKGKLTKVAKRHYRLTATKGGKEYVIDNIINLMDDDEQYQTTRYSLELRHGIDPKFIVDDIDKSSYITSFRKVIGRTLKNYIKDGESGGSCPTCGSQLRYESGCKSCPNCGYSQCG